MSALLIDTSAYSAFRRGFALFMAIPMWMSFYYSLTDYSLLEAPVFIGAENYRELMRDDLFWVTVRNTGVYALFSVTLGAALAIGLALLLNQRMKGVGLVRAVVFLPMLVPLVATALGWMWLFNGEVGNT